MLSRLGCLWPFLVKASGAGLVPRLNEPQARDWTQDALPRACPPDERDELLVFLASDLVFFVYLPPFDPLGCGFDDLLLANSAYGAACLAPFLCLFHKLERATVKLRIQES